jgi:hypothetical protein
VRVDGGGGRRELVEVGFAELFALTPEITLTIPAPAAPPVPEPVVAIEPVIDPATGLFKLYQITRASWQLDIALKLWWHYFTWQVECPERPELHGAILQGANPHAEELLREQVHASRHALFGPNKVGHCCIYYHNQFVLSSRELLALLPKGR